MSEEQSPDLCLKGMASFVSQYVVCVPGSDPALSGFAMRWHKTVCKWTLVAVFSADDSIWPSTKSVPRYHFTKKISKSVPRYHFTKKISITIQMWREIPFALIHIEINLLPHIFAHNTTAVLSQHMWWYHKQRWICLHCDDINTKMHNW